MDAPVEAVLIHHNTIDGRQPDTGNGWKMVTFCLLRPCTYAELQLLATFAHDVVWALTNTFIDVNKRIKVCLTDAEGNVVAVLESGKDLVGGETFGAVVLVARGDTELGLAHPIVEQVTETADQSGWLVFHGEDCEPVELKCFEPVAEPAAP